MEILLLGVTAVASIFASGGVWSYLQFRHGKNDSQTRMIRGIAYTTLVNQSARYLRRGKISHSEYVELTRMLYEPYKDLGGNGAADRAFKAVGELPITNEDVIAEAKEQGLEEMQKEYGVDDRNEED